MLAGIYELLTPTDHYLINTKAFMYTIGIKPWMPETNTNEILPLPIRKAKCGSMNNADITNRYPSYLASENLLLHNMTCLEPSKW